MKKNKISGVYMIHNKANNRVYIGSSKDIERRIKTHKLHLNKGCHSCRLMQKHYDENPNDFEFMILKEINEDKYLTSAERYYIQKHNALSKMYGYNEKLPTVNFDLYKEIRTLLTEEENND